MSTRGLGLLSLAAGALLALPAFAAPESVLPGDRVNAKRLWRLQCAGCHGDGAEPTRIGRALGVFKLRDAAFLAGRDDDQLIATILKGGPGKGSPALGGSLTLLDAGDLVALLRAGLPTVGDVFPDGAAYIAKSYTLSGPALQRAETLSGREPLLPEERELTVFSVYGGERPPTGLRLVPDDPVSLDELPVKAKKGYVIFGEIGGANGEPQPVAMGLGPDFVVTGLKTSAQGPELSKIAPAVLGKGGPPGKRKPFVAKAAPGAARALTRLYARGVEAAALAAKEEADRHIFDAPEKSAASKSNP